MNSRTWLAISLACFIWFSYLKWFAPVPSSSAQNQGVIATDQQANSPSGEVVTNPTSITEVSSQEISLSEQLQKVANSDFEVGFSSLGGRPAEIELKKYTTSIEKNAHLIRTLSPVVSSYSLATLFTDSELSSLGNSDFSTDVKGSVVKMSSTEKGGLKIYKEYIVSDSGFMIDAAIKIQSSKSTRKNYGYLSIPVGAKGLEYSHEIPLKAWEVVYFQDEKSHRIVWDKLPETEQIKQGNTSWIALGNRYFSTAIVNQSEINPDLILTRTKDFTGAYLRFPVVIKEGQGEVSYKFKVYSGPKIVTELSKVNGLKELVDYGTFSFFAYPLLATLRFFNGYVHNFGIAIILLTLLVRALFYPLSIKSFKSMKAMQKLQPQIALLKEKYKDDMSRMNQEQMALFKAHKVNPMGGCFPMLIQLPVFIALYAVLGNSIELFQAPFFGWVQDLSAKDPFYIYPVLMGIAMFFQQKLTPAAGMDPAQQKIMLFMPVIFSFMMVSLPAGLTLYIFVSTLLGILQQWSMMRDTKTITPLTIAEATQKTK